MKFALALLGSLLTGCSLTYEKDQGVQPDQIPQMVFEDLHQTGMKDGRLLYTMETGGAEVYQTKKQMLLKRFQFREYDSRGTLASQGEADAAVIDTSTNDARLIGSLKARSEEQKVTVETGGASGGLSWKDEDHVLKTDPNTTVSLSKDDGSRIEARGMVLDLGTNSLQLEGGVQGTWTPETKENANQGAHPPDAGPHP
jgi:LPS export ABC transporter protein LptC